MQEPTLPPVVRTRSHTWGTKQNLEHPPEPRLARACSPRSPRSPRSPERSALPHRFIQGHMSAPCTLYLHGTLYIILTLYKILTVSSKAT